MAVAALLAGVGFGLTGLASTWLLFGLSVGVWTLGEIVASTIAPAIVADLSPVDLRGLFQGAFAAAWGLSAFAGPLLGGWIYQRYGAGALWSACLVLGGFLALGYLALGRRARRAA
jgi:MFS family permease